MSAARRSFSQLPVLWVQVTPKGFVIRQTEAAVATLEGHVVRQRFERKLFLDGMLACGSLDGEMAYDGKTRCQDCRHPLCQPRIRLRLADRHAHYLVDLAISSARNFFALEDGIQEQGLHLESQRLRLTVIDRGYFGEIRFERLD